MSVGYQVVLLHGGTTPFVLRHNVVSQTYELLGDCYVHGIMDGELARHADAESFTYFDLASDCVHDKYTAMINYRKTMIRQGS